MIRLLKLDENGRMVFECFGDDDAPAYAILSHTWSRPSEQELRLQDIQNSTGHDKIGYRKVRFCLERAAEDGLRYCWVDSCCINKESSAEETRAINSMFRWYQNAARCYVYLSDVSAQDSLNGGSLPQSAWEDDFRASAWFTRGWTLQELLAPSKLQFFSFEGLRLGDKKSLEQIVCEVTNLPAQALRGAPLSTFRHQDRRLWAVSRQTTDPEDKAYCLLGIHEVSMPLNYGEGLESAIERLDEQCEKSARRLQTSVLGKRSLSDRDDVSEHLRFDRQRHNGRLQLHDESKSRLIESLKFGQIVAQDMSIRKSHPRTCQWLLQDSKYQAWMDSSDLHRHHGFIWIKGKSGSGQSTIMKFALASAQQRLSEVIVQPDLKTLYRFANKKKLDTPQQNQMVEGALKVAMIFVSRRRSRPYTVDYTKPIAEIYKSFVELFIYRSRSLDIIVHPWAAKPDPATDSSHNSEFEPSPFDILKRPQADWEALSPENSSSSSSDESEDDGFRNFNTAVGPLFGQDDGTPIASSPVPEDRHRSKHTHFETQSFPNKNTVEQYDRTKKRPRTMAALDLGAAQVTAPEYSRDPERSSELPSWICDRTHMPSSLSIAMDEDIKPIDPKNADLLVGLPDAGYYQASGKLPVNMEALHFQSRTENDHSMFVKGFVLFEVKDAGSHADLTNIPISEWRELAGGDEGVLLRIMIADRGPKGTRMPPYFVSAFDQAFKDQKGAYDMKAAITGSNSFMEELLKRVRQVTFNRKLIKTAMPERIGLRKARQRDGEGREPPVLGLVPRAVKPRHDGKSGTGDLVCILYGLSVPVILRKVIKSADERMMDHRAQQEKLPEAFRRAVEKIETQWSLNLALKDGIVALTRRHWARYEREGNDILKKWRSSIRHIFPRPWLSQIEQEYDEKQRRIRYGSPPPILDVPKVGRSKPERQMSNLTDEQRANLWDEMKSEWAEYLDKHQDWSSHFKCSKYDAEVPSPAEYYKVVGECYIDRMMDGQALDYKRKHEIQDQTFELR